MAIVILYTKATCPYCINAKRLLDSKGATYTEIDYVYDLTGDERAALAQKTNNYRTVPQIFINDAFIGGFSDLDKLNQEGKLDSLLSA